MIKQFPSHADYDRSMSALNKLVKVPHLKSGVPAKNKEGKFYAIPGGFAKVYKINSQQKEYALRCWLAEQSEIGERYKEIKNFLKNTTLPYFINFDYYEKGIAVTTNGSCELYPVICMHWIKHPTLGKFIKNNLTNTTAMEKISDAFLSMVKDLHNNKIAHGDLQVGNIIVIESGGNFSLKLIDYDSLYFPGMEKFSNLIGGVAGFQSPYRPIGYYNDRMDYFSELVIYLSLKVLARDPDNNSMLCAFPEEILLFKEDDFKNPSNSFIFKYLSTETIAIKKLLEVMHDYCNVHNIDKLLPLEGILSQIANNSYQKLGINPNKPQIKTIPTVYPQKNVGKQKSTVIKTPDAYVKTTPIGNTPVSQTNSIYPANKPSGVKISQVIKCHICNEIINNPSLIYCSNGHQISPMVKICPKCKRKIPFLSNFCPKCGKMV